MAPIIEKLISKNIKCLTSGFFVFLVGLLAGLTGSLSEQGVWFHGAYSYSPLLTLDVITTLSMNSGILNYS